MNNPVPKPGAEPHLDPAALTHEVDTALREAAEHQDPSGQLLALEAVHQKLAAALSTIDKA